MILNHIEIVPIYVPTDAIALRLIFFLNKHANWLIHIQIILNEFPAITQPFQGLGSVRFKKHLLFFNWALWLSIDSKGCYHDQRTET